MIEFLKEKQEQFIESMDKAHLQWLKEQHEPVLRQVLQRFHLTAEFQALGLDKRITEPVHEIDVRVNRFGVVLNVRYQFLEKPKSKYTSRAVRKLNNLLSERDYGYLQESNYLSAFTGEKRTYISTICIQNNNLFVAIAVGHLSEVPYEIYG